MRKNFPENKVITSICEDYRAPVGMFVYMKDASVIDIAGAIGLDFVIIDSEHAVMERETIERMITAAQMNDVMPVVRVPDTIPWLMRNYMEMGAQAIMVPHIKNREECRKAQLALRYPPDGNASCCRSIRSDGYQASKWQDYLKWAKTVSFVPLIEDPEGVENIEEILKELQPGRDIVMFGKADYSQVIGALNPDGSINPAVNEGYYKVIEACRKQNIWFMACPSTPKAETIAEETRKVICEGASAVVINTDQMLLAGALRSIFEPCSKISLNS